MKRRSSSASSGRIGRIASCVPSRSTMRDSSSSGYGWIAMCAYAGCGFFAGSTSARAAGISTRSCATMTGSSASVRTHGSAQASAETRSTSCTSASGGSAIPAAAKRSRASRRLSGGSITARSRGTATPRTLAPTAIAGPNTGSVDSVIAHVPVVPGGGARWTTTLIRAGSPCARSSFHARASARPLARHARSTGGSLPASVSVTG